MINTSEDKWRSTPSTPALNEGDVDVWKVDLACDPFSILSLCEVLSEDERLRSDKFVFARDRDHFIAGRASLRRIIGGYLTIAPEKISFSTLRFGKPYLADGNKLRFNVSHSNGIAAIAISQNRQVGIDIEIVDRNFDIFSVASKVFSEEQVSRMRSLNLNSRAEHFFAGWTRKEAFLKAMGDGLSSSEEVQNAVSLINEEDASFRSVENNKITDWSLTSFKIHDDFKAALVVEGKMGKVRYWSLRADQAIVCRQNLLRHTYQGYGQSVEEPSKKKPLQRMSTLCAE